MTNAELLAKIKAEIERLKKYNHLMADNAINSNMRNFYDGEEDCCKQFLSFLSTLEEQPKEVRNPIFDECVAKVDPEVREEVRENIYRILEDDSLIDEIKNFIKEYGYERGEDKLLIAIVARHFYELGCRRTAEKYDEIEYNRQREETAYDTRQYTPRPSVDIEDVARVQFASHAKVFDKKRKAVFDWEQFKEVAGIFYGFGKKDLEPEKPVTADLEEAARKYQEGVPVDTTIHYCGADEDVYFANRIVDAVIAGANWQKGQNDKDLSEKIAAAYQLGLADKEKQMMKEAVKGRVSYFESREVAVIYYDDPKGNTMCFFAPSSSLETGDKVRIIVCKNED